jgi:arsenical pump membrane protein
VEAASAYSTVAVTLGLVVARPRLGARIRLSPAVSAIGGVLVMLAIGVLHPADIAYALTALVRPMLGIAALVVMTAGAERVGVLDVLAARTLGRASGSAERLFLYVFLLSVAVAALLNNDSAILLLTPAIVALAKRRFPTLVLPFAFAVFMGAGVAPMLVSNPMNMVVASFANIGFNAYALRMTPVAACGWLVTFIVLWRVFRRDLRAATRLAESTEALDDRFTRSRLAVLAILVALVPAYSVCGLVGAPVWLVALGGAVLVLAVAKGAGVATVPLLRRDVSWEILVFVSAMFALSIGLKNVGLVDRLRDAYDGAGVFRIGVVSALGSALFNNHPMGHLNMMALDGGGERSRVLAALVGGDLGPRLFPMGSLAGLLWLERLRRAGVSVSLVRFVVIGAVVTIPTLVVSLALLSKLP